MCSPVLNSNFGAGFFTGIRVSTPSWAGCGATGCGGDFGAAALAGEALATAAGVAAGAALRRGVGAAAPLAGFAVATLAAAGLRAAAACFFTGFAAFRAAAAATALRLVSVFFFVRVALGAVFADFARFS